MKINEQSVGSQLVNYIGVLANVRMVSLIKLQFCIIKNRFNFNVVVGPNVWNVGIDVGSGQTTQKDIIVVKSPHRQITLLYSKNNTSFFSLN